jgi:hypothetical protein
VQSYGSSGSMLRRTTFVDPLMIITAKLHSAKIRS